LDNLKIIELVSVIFNMIFLVLLTKENRVCWIFGIIGSLLGAWILYKNFYYSETLLYLFYAVIGYFAYIYWGINSSILTIRRMNWLTICKVLIGGVVASLGLGCLMSKTDASKPYFDALSSVFGVVATFLELYKYLISWIFWIFLNGYTVWLYELKELDFLAIQMILYTLLSVYGYYQWSKKLLTEST